MSGVIEGVQRAMSSAALVVLKKKGMSKLQPLYTVIYLHMEILMMHLICS